MMISFTENDIHYGAGAFEQMMRSQTKIPSRAGRLTPGAAVGILSAGMRSGLPIKIIDQVIDQRSDADAALLKRVLEACEGSDWTINLWHRLPSGYYKLCTELCRPGLAQWRYDRSLVEEA